MITTKFVQTNDGLFLSLTGTLPFFLVSDLESQIPQEIGSQVQWAHQIQSD